MTGDLELLLSSAGLEVLGTIRDVCGIKPSDAWKPVVRLGITPTIAIPDDDRGEADRLRDVNLQWLRMADEEGMISTDGSFMVGIAGTGTVNQPWYQVRIADDLRLAQVLCVNPGEPEFITAALDCHVVIGVTTEEYGIWLIKVTDLLRGNSMPTE